MTLPEMYAAAGEYPEIENASRCEFTVAILKKLYCSKKSETTAVLQYVYQHLVANKYAKHAAKIFAEIGKVEMKHMDLLGEAMIKFGGDPVFYYFDTPLNGGWVNYSKNLFQMLMTNINDEKEAARQYRAAAEKVKNESLKLLLLRISEDEQIQADLQLKLLEELVFWKE